MVWQLRINAEDWQVAAVADTPLLWILRDHLHLTGTKFGCGVGQCGSCTVHLDGEAVRSCQVSVAKAAGCAVTTIEGLSRNGPHPIQAAWIAEKVSQCGYCQPGFIMAATALLARNPCPTQAEIRAQMTNLCRCGTYLRVLRAIKRAAANGLA
jgi:isoquinoline 1-oxidoreductase subunit alpha